MPTGIFEKRLKDQFDLRSSEFDTSAKWVCDKALIRAHADLAGKPNGEALELCCGTGRVGTALKARGWSVRGVDMTEGMLRISSRAFPVLRGRAENIPFRSGALRLVVCRQSFQFLDVGKTLSEVRRVLAPGGIFVVGLTVPFSEEDREWLCAIHRKKQPLLAAFYTAEDLLSALRKAGFSVEKTRRLRVRESIDRWMEHAPELAPDVRRRVIEMVRDAPAAYRNVHRVKVVGSEVFEDWSWIVVRATAGT